jgi:hypothetical protein
VSSIATVHNGTVHATAVPDGGLDITVRLPRRHRQEQNDHVRTDGEQRSAASPPREKSHSKSQRRPTSGDQGRRKATVEAGQVHSEPSPATSSDAQR